MNLSKIFPVENYPLYGNNIYIYYYCVLFLLYLYAIVYTLSLWIRFLSLICTRQELVAWNEARFPKVITTVQCCICSQLNNKPRVVVTDFSCTIPAVYGFTH